MTDHSDLIFSAREQASKRAVDSPIYNLLHELADALEEATSPATIAKVRAEGLREIAEATTTRYVIDQKNKRHAREDHVHSQTTRAWLNAEADRIEKEQS